VRGQGRLHVTLLLSVLIAAFDFELPEPDALLHRYGIIVQHNKICGLCPQPISLYDLTV
jgi:hypothetical protein